MSVNHPTHTPIPRWLRRTLVVSIPVVVAAAAIIAATLGADKAVAHPSYGQPCQCHGATAAPTVTVATSVAKVRVRKAIKVTGSVSPGFPGLKAQLQVKRGGAAWKTYKTLILSAQSTVAATWKAKVKGRYSFRLYYLGDNQYAAGASAVKVVRVR
jgi:hypothetical protein